MNLQIPEGISEFLPQPINESASELIVLELYRQSRISSGKAAELLAETREAFLRRAAAADIPYFNLTPEDLDDEICAAADIATARRF